MTTPDVRVQRLCDVCFQVDDDPRHVTFTLEGGVPTADELARIPDGTPATAIAEVLEPTTVIRHFDCCASRGCPTCSVQLQLAGPKTRGAKLLKHITENGDAHREAVERATGVWEINQLADNEATADKVAVENEQGV